MSDALPDIPGCRHVQRLGNGRVHLYHDVGADRDVAVKLFGGVAPAAVRERLLAESKALSGYPNIVPVHRIGETQAGHLYVQMDYCPHGPISRTLSVEQALDLGVQLASALHTAHERGIAHRNIKPGNILLDEHRMPCLSDIGLSGRSPLWSAPEVLGSGTFNVRADVFSLGATLWHLLVGHSPFVVPNGDNTRATVEQRIMHGSPRPTGRAPRAMEELLRAAMAVNPFARPASAEELAVALQEIQRSAGVAETPLTPAVVVSTAPAAPPKRRWPLYTGVGVLAAAAAAAGVFLLPGGNSPELTPPVQPQNAGGDQQTQSGLPGAVSVKADRVDDGTVKFSWTYTGGLATDTFVWRTNDGLKTGVVTVPSVELPAAGVLCIEVKVVRADGSNSAGVFSPEGCSS